MQGDPERRAALMSDFAFVILGLGSFALLAAYARFTSKA